MVYFGALIIIVTGLLLLPISTSDIIFTNFPIAFFTAVSALSTCGIPVVNTGEYWSMFGQVVVLFSIQFGGLGVMTFASMVALGVSRRLKVSQRMLTANELGTTKLSEVKGVLTVVLGTSIIAEVLTFVLLLPDLFRVNHGNMGRTLWQALFYAVSAYNNTGFTPDATGLVPAGRVGQYRPVPRRRSRHEDAPCDERRRIPRRIQMTAVSVTTACFALVMVGAMMLMFTTGCAFVDAVFEACSAFSLGGYSVGVASAGNPASLFILSAEMIVGRLGPLTIAYSISRPMAPEPIRYPQENIIVG